jgi:hypothetical protein
MFDQIPAGIKSDIFQVSGADRLGANGLVHRGFSPAITHAKIFESKFNSTTSSALNQTSSKF